MLPGFRTWYFVQHVSALLFSLCVKQVYAGTKCSQALF